MAKSAGIYRVPVYMNTAGALLVTVGKKKIRPGSHLQEDFLFVSKLPDFKRKTKVVDKDLTRQNLTVSLLAVG